MTTPKVAVSASTLDAAEKHVARVECVIARLRAIYGFSDSEAILFMQQFPDDAIPEPPKELTHD